MWTRTYDHRHSGAKAAHNKKRKKKRFLENTFVILGGALSMLHASADACPPLKSVSGSLTYIVDALEVRTLSFLMVQT